MDNVVRGMLSTRGGRLQRLASAEFCLPAPAHRSSLVDALLSMVCWGSVSCPTARWLAKCALQDGASHPELSKLAGIGTEGTYPGNTRRDLLRQFMKRTTVPKCLLVRVPTLDKHNREEPTLQAVLQLPELLQALWENHKTLLMDQYLGQNPRGFWEACDSGDPRFQRMHAITDLPGWEDRTWPFILHGDGGVYAKKTQSSILTVSCKSMLSLRFKSNILPGFALPKHVRTAAAADGLWRSYIHGLNAAFIGVHPPQDAFGDCWPHGSPQATLAGTPICGGEIRIVIWVVTGDLEFFSNECRMAHFNSLEPCWLCPISRRPGTPFPITDLSLRAAWKQQLSDSFETDWAGGHAIASIHGITRFHFPGDFMHTADGGVSSLLVGSALSELLFDGPFAGTTEERLRALWDEILAAYAVSRSANRISMLTLSMFWHGAGKWAAFTGKCAETRTMVYIVRDICRAFHDGSDRDRHRLVCFDRLCSIYDACFRHNLHIPAPDAECILEDYDIFLVHYHWLCANGANKGMLVYNIVPKVHMLWHICFLSRYTNPTACWAYEFEDYVGTVIDAAKGCMSGTPLAMVGTKVLQNFLLELNIRLHRG